jgi:hypothetical protein
MMTSEEGCECSWRWAGERVDAACLQNDDADNGDAVA